MTAKGRSVARTCSPADYLTDITYPAEFHPEQAPSWLAAVLAALGRVAPAGSDWCELGCGQGFAALMMAAANPGMRVTGIDINPDHIRTAQARARAAGLTNLRFLCADIRDPDLIEGSFAWIVTHGMLSWVGDDVREALAGFVARKLAPDGVAAVHYMSEPGGAAFRAFHSVFRQMIGRPDPVAEGLALLKAMRDAQAGFFQLHPHAAQTLDHLLTQVPEYVAHEYMNPHFRPLAFHEVNKLFADADLQWLGSARPIENIEAMSVPADALKALSGTTDIALRETAKDMARNQAQRYDIFARPSPAPGDGAHLALLRRTVWGLLPGAPFLGAQAREMTIATPIGPVGADARIFRPLLGRLGEGAARFDQFEAIAPFAGRPGLLNQSLQMGLGARIMHPVQRMAAPPTAATRLNRLLLREAREGAHIPALAAPALGSGLEVTPGDLASLREGGGPAHLRMMFAL